MCHPRYWRDRRARVHRWARSYRRSRRDAVSRSRSGIHLRLSNWRRSGLHLLHLWNDRCAEGVLGVHAGLSHFIAWQRKAFDIGSGDRAAQLTGLSFDVVLRDVFMPLASGATLVIPDSSDVLPDRMIEWLSAARITLMHTVPSLAASWVADGEHSGRNPALHLLRRRAADRWLGPPLADKRRPWWRHRQSLRTDRDDARQVLLHAASGSGARCPGDRIALPQCQVLVLDSLGRPCGLGQPGEIHIRTPYRTLGYLNPAAGSDSRFWVNPKRDDPGDRIYRTGDRGRYRYDGVLEILGRLDDQIKIRGIRIEPVEIQSVIARHPAVAEAIVLASASGEQND